MINMFNQKYSIGINITLATGSCGDLRPADEASCNEGPCSFWWTDDWGDCSATCGQGWQKRTVRCLKFTEDEIEEETAAEVTFSKFILVGDGTAQKVELIASHPVVLSLNLPTAGRMEHNSFFENLPF